MPAWPSGGGSGSTLDPQRDMEVQLRERLALVDDLFPEFSADPQVAYRIASMPVSTDEMLRQAGQTVSFEQAAQHRATLEAMGDDAQRATWESMSEARRHIYTQVGYVPPPETRKDFLNLPGSLRLRIPGTQIKSPDFLGAINPPDNPIGKVVTSPAWMSAWVAGRGLQALDRGGRLLPETWRLLFSMGDLTGAHDHQTPTGIPLLDETFRMGRNLSHLITNPTGIGEMWDLATNAGGLTLPEGTERALDHLKAQGLDESQALLAIKVARAKLAGHSLERAAADILGYSDFREATADPRWEDAVLETYALFNDDDVKAASAILEPYQVSVGRDIGRLLGAQEGSVAWRITSASIDFTAAFVDPTLAAGKVTKVAKLGALGSVGRAEDLAARTDRILRAINAGDTVSGNERHLIAEIARHQGLDVSDLFRPIEEGESVSRGFNLSPDALRDVRIRDTFANRAVGRGVRTEDAIIDSTTDLLATRDRLIDEVGEGAAADRIEMLTYRTAQRLKDAPAPVRAAGVKVEKFMEAFMPGLVSGDLTAVRGLYQFADRVAEAFVAAERGEDSLRTLAADIPALRRDGISLLRQADMDLRQARGEGIRTAQDVLDAFRDRAGANLLATSRIRGYESPVLFMPRFDPVHAHWARAKWMINHKIEDVTDAEIARIHTNRRDAGLPDEHLADLGLDLDELLVSDYGSSRVTTAVTRTFFKALGALTRQVPKDQVLNLTGEGVDHQFLQLLDMGRGNFTGRELDAWFQRFMYGWERPDGRVVFNPATRLQVGLSFIHEMFIRAGTDLTDEGREVVSRFMAGFRQQYDQVVAAPMRAEFIDAAAETPNALFLRKVTEEGRALNSQAHAVWPDVDVTMRIAIPNYDEVAEVMARMSKLNIVMRSTPVKLMHTVMSKLFIPMWLLRPGFPLRVVADEMLSLVLFQGPREYYRQKFVIPWAMEQRAPSVAEAMRSTGSLQYFARWNKTLDRAEAYARQASAARADAIRRARLGEGGAVQVLDETEEVGRIVRALGSGNAAARLTRRIGFQMADRGGLVWRYMRESDPLVRFRARQADELVDWSEVESWAGMLEHNPLMLVAFTQDLLGARPYHADMYLERDVQLRTGSEDIIARPAEGPIALLPPGDTGADKLYGNVVRGDFDPASATRYWTALAHEASRLGRDRVSRAGVEALIEAVAPRHLLHPRFPARMDMSRNYGSWGSAVRSSVDDLDADLTISELDQVFSEVLGDDYSHPIDWSTVGPKVRRWLAADPAVKRGKAMLRDKIEVKELLTDRELIRLRLHLTLEGGIERYGLEALDDFPYALAQIEMAEETVNFQRALLAAADDPDAVANLADVDIENLRVLRRFDLDRGYLDGFRTRMAAEADAVGLEGLEFGQTLKPRATLLGVLDHAQPRPLMDPGAIRDAVRQALRARMRDPDVAPRVMAMLESSDKGLVNLPVPGTQLYYAPWVRLGDADDDQIAAAADALADRWMTYVHAHTQAGADAASTRWQVLSQFAEPDEYPDEVRYFVDDLVDLTIREDNDGRPTAVLRDQLVQFFAEILAGTRPAVARWSRDVNEAERTATVVADFLMSRVGRGFDPDASVTDELLAFEFDVAPGARHIPLGKLRDLGLSPQGDIEHLGRARHRHANEMMLGDFIPIRQRGDELLELKFDDAVPSLVREEVERATIARLWDIPDDLEAQLPPTHPAYAMRIWGALDSARWDTIGKRVDLSVDDSHDFGQALRQLVDERDMDGLRRLLDSTEPDDLAAIQDIPEIFALYDDVSAAESLLRHLRTSLDFSLSDMVVITRQDGIPGVSLGESEKKLLAMLSSPAVRHQIRDAGWLGGPEEFAAYTREVTENQRRLYRTIRETETDPTRRPSEVIEGLDDATLAQLRIIEDRMLTDAAGSLIGAFGEQLLGFRQFRSTLEDGLAALSRVTPARVVTRAQAGTESMLGLLTPAQRKVLGARHTATRERLIGAFFLPARDGQPVTAWSYAEQRRQEIASLLRLSAYDSVTTPWNTPTIRFGDVPDAEARVYSGLDLDRDILDGLGLAGPHEASMGQYGLGIEGSETLVPEALAPHAVPQPIFEMWSEMVSAGIEPPPSFFEVDTWVGAGSVLPGRRSYEHALDDLAERQTDQLLATFTNSRAGESDQLPDELVAHLGIAQEALMGDVSVETVASVPLEHMPQTIKARAEGDVEPTPRGLLASLEAFKNGYFDEVGNIVGAIARMQRFSPNLHRRWQATGSLFQHVLTEPEKETLSLIWGALRRRGTDGIDRSVSDAMKPWTNPQVLGELLGVFERYGPIDSTAHYWNRVVNDGRLRLTSSTDPRVAETLRAWADDEELAALRAVEDVADGPFTFVDEISEQAAGDLRALAAEGNKAAAAEADRVEAFLARRAALREDPVGVFIADHDRALNGAVGALRDRRADVAAIAEGQTAGELEEVRDLIRVHFPDRRGTWNDETYATAAREVLAGMDQLDSMPSILRDEIVVAASSRIGADGDIPLWSDAQFQAIARKLENHQEERARLVATAAIEDTVPFVDDYRVRSQFQQQVRTFIPFMFAEEAFIKRWARLFATENWTFASIRKAQLSLAGLQQIGWVGEDDDGNLILNFPGTAWALEQLTPFVGRLTGNDAAVGIQGNLSGRMRYMLPGLDSMGAPSPSPVITMGLDVVRKRARWLTPVIGENAIDDRSALEQLFPSSLTGIVRGIWGDTDDGELQATMMQAAQHLMAVGRGPENEAGIVTEQDMEDWVRVVEDTARTLLVLRRVAGFTGPTTPQVIFNDDVSQFSDEFRELLEATGSYSEAWLAFLEQHPDASATRIFRSSAVSGAPLPLTADAFSFISDHRDLMDRFPRGAGWLLPQTEGPYSNAAYRIQMETGLRESKEHADFVEELVYAEASDLYYTEKRRHDDKQKALKAAGLTDEARQDQLLWESWKARFDRQHPLFERLQRERGIEAEARRDQVLAELRSVKDWEGWPDTDHTRAVRDLVDNFTRFHARFRALRHDRRKNSIQNAEFELARFLDWAETLVEEVPSVRPLFTRIILPELGLDEAEFLAREEAA